MAQQKQLLTVIQLVRWCAPDSDVHLALWSRRARLWSEQGILPTATSDRGSRNSRLYDPETIYLAAVLFRISDFGVDAAVLKGTSSYIQRNSQGRGDFPKLWRDAKKLKTEGPDAYIAINLDPYYPDPKIYWNAPEMELPIKTLLNNLLPTGRGPAVILNLSAIFEELKMAAEEAQPKRRRSEP